MLIVGISVCLISHLFYLLSNIKVKSMHTTNEMKYFTFAGVAFFILYSTNTEIGGLSLPDYSQSALPPVSQIFLASSIDFYEGECKRLST